MAVAPLSALIFSRFHGEIDDSGNRQLGANHFAKDSGVLLSQFGRLGQGQLRSAHSLTARNNTSETPVAQVTFFS